jgi:tRNA threonylcarbamoyladenosine biosynthesis protein TsaB
MILALKTDGPTTSLWLVDGKVPSQPTAEWDSGRELADGLLGWLTDRLAEHKLETGDFTGFIIFSGPGSFTSLRIGHTVINALADGLGVPVVGTRGDDWIPQGIDALKTTPAGRPALPFYGAEANITRPTG